MTQPTTSKGRHAPLSRPSVWAVWVVCFLHVFWGLVLLATRQDIPFTALFELQRWAEPTIVGSALLVAGALPVLGPRARGWLRYAVLAPQQLLVVLALMGSIHIVVLGRFVTGQPAPRWGLLASQSIPITVWLAYLFAVPGVLRRWSRA